MFPQLPLKFIALSFDIWGGAEAISHYAPHLTITSFVRKHLPGLGARKRSGNKVYCGHYPGLLTVSHNSRFVLAVTQTPRGYKNWIISSSIKKHLKLRAKHIAILVTCRNYSGSHSKLEKRLRRKSLKLQWKIIPKLWLKSIRFLYELRIAAATGTSWKEMKVLLPTKKIHCSTSHRCWWLCINVCGFDFST